MTRITEERVREALEKNRTGRHALMHLDKDEVIARMRAAGLFDPPGEQELTVDGRYDVRLAQLIDCAQTWQRNDSLGNTEIAKRDKAETIVLARELTPLLAPCEDLRPTRSELPPIYHTGYAPNDPIQLATVESQRDYINRLEAAGFIKPDPTPPMPEFESVGEAIAWLDSTYGTLKTVENGKRKNSWGWHIQHWSDTDPDARWLAMGVKANREIKAYGATPDDAIFALCAAVWERGEKG